MTRKVAVKLCVATLFFFSCDCSTTEVLAQTIARDRSHFPRACSFFERGASSEAEAEDDPGARKLDEAVNKLYRLYCTTNSGTPAQRVEAANKVANLWKTLWYRDDPFNAAFHETGSFTLLVLMGITHRIPGAMFADRMFLNDWLADCSERCFMTYGDDDPGAHAEWLQMMRLRQDVQEHLGYDPSSKLVRKMLNNAKLYPVR